MLDKEPRGFVENGEACPLDAAGLEEWPGRSAPARGVSEREDRVVGTGGARPAAKEAPRAAGWDKDCG